MSGFTDSEKRSLEELGRIDPFTAIADHFDEILKIRDERDRYKAALNKIAAYDDIGASSHLKTTGKYSRFDEPDSVRIAREVLEKDRG